MKILGVDPGKSTGWALIVVEDKTIRPINLGITKDMTLLEIKDMIEEADLIVYEGFWIRPSHAETGRFNWDEMPAPKVIGSLQTLAALFERKLVKQSSAQKPVGYGFAGMKYQKGAHGKHAEDALAHAVYYAVTKLQAHPVRKK